MQHDIRWRADSQDTCHPPPPLLHPSLHTAGPHVAKLGSLAQRAAQQWATRGRCAMSVLRWFTTQLVDFSPWKYFFFCWYFHTWEPQRRLSDYQLLFTKPRFEYCATWIQRALRVRKCSFQASRLKCWDPPSGAPAGVGNTFSRDNSRVAGCSAGGRAEKSESLHQSNRTLKREEGRERQWCLFKGCQRTPEHNAPHFLEETCQKSLTSY